MSGTHTHCLNGGGLGHPGYMQGHLYTCATKMCVIIFNHCLLICLLPLFSPQRWRRKASFIQHSVSGLCLEATSTQLLTSKCQVDAPAQQWQLLPHT